MKKTFLLCAALLTALTVCSCKCEEKAAKTTGVDNETIQTIMSRKSLVSERVYKDDMDPSEALRMIFDGECGNFNPALLESLKACSQKILTVYIQTPGAAAE